METEKREASQGSINMIMSFFFIALSAAIGVGMWFLVIGIVFSIGGGSLFVTHYDSLFFYSAVLLLCIVSYLWFIKHLFEKNLELLLLICVGTTMLFFSLQVGLTNHRGRTGNS